MEFAIVLPIVLLILMAAIDFGRLFYGWVGVTNAARVAANYAAANPNLTYTATAPAAYWAQINADTQSTLAGNCPLNTVGNGIPDFNDSAGDSNATDRDLGDTVVVSISCRFRILTPIVSRIVGNTIDISASTTFPIRNGAYNP